MHMHAESVAGHMQAPASAYSDACTAELATEPRLAAATGHGSGHQLRPQKLTPDDIKCTRALPRCPRGSLSRGSAHKAQGRRRSLPRLSELVALQGALHFFEAPAVQVRAGGVGEQLHIKF